MTTKIWKLILKDDVKKLENYLKNEEVDLNNYNDQGLTVLLYAIENGCKECSYYLIKEKKVNIFLKDKKNEENALMKCFKLKNDMIDINRLLINKIDVNEQNKEGKTCLHIASINNYVNGIEILLRNNANINILDCDNNTPLMSAIKHSSIESILLLLENNANINIKDKYNNSVLHICAKEHLSNIAKIILTKNIDIENCIDNDNNTPLHIAAKENLSALCNIFLDKFDPLHKNKYNETYLDILKKNENVELINEENKKKTYEEKELRRRNEKIENMKKTEVYNFLKINDLETYGEQFYKYNYFNIDNEFLKIKPHVLKYIIYDNISRRHFYNCVNKYIEKEKEEIDNLEETQKKLEKSRNMKLMYAIILVCIIFFFLFVFGSIKTIKQLIKTKRFL